MSELQILYSCDRDNQYLTVMPKSCNLVPDLVLLMRCLLADFEKVLTGQMIIVAFPLKLKAVIYPDSQIFLSLYLNLSNIFHLAEHLNIETSIDVRRSPFSLV